ncbi:hypothetical protein ACFQZ4_11440 [Catellatospora coxensis]
MTAAAVPGVRLLGQPGRALLGGLPGPQAERRRDPRPAHPAPARRRQQIPFRMVDRGTQFPQVRQCAEDPVRVAAGCGQHAPVQVQSDRAGVVTAPGVAGSGHARPGRQVTGGSAGAGSMARFGR